MPSRSSKLFYIIAGVVLIVIIGVYIYLQNNSTPTTSALPPYLYSALLKSSNIYGETLNLNLPFQKGPSKTVWYNGSKVVVVYIGTEWCPYCAAQRWALIIALLRFGNFSGLTLLKSSDKDNPPNVPTFSFYNSVYQSNYVQFLAYEIQDRNGNNLMTLPPQYNQIFQSYQSSIPLIIIGGVLVQVGSAVNPTPMSNMDWNWTIYNIQIQSALGKQIIDSANQITAAICLLSGNKPENVCKNPIIQQIEIYISQKYNISYTM
ncbi:MAG: DUF929 family protein [Sulfolobaceae archaeon]